MVIEEAVRLASATWPEMYLNGLTPYSKSIHTDRMQELRTEVQVAIESVEAAPGILIIGQHVVLSV